ncbi:hypothetical protein FRC08_000362 [Ceratobasidium sp. 394]|nr:hypothetical protein FRC08_000362 [Ceratobasidium sp. 394]
MPNLEHTKSNLPSVTTGIDDDGDDLGEVQDESGRSVADDSSSENESQVPARKRTRTSLTSTKTRKRYVRGKQGGLKGLMEMPIEIFTEIAYLLTPGDLIALARSSKFFRGVLLQRSAIHMWRRAQQNMPRLPSCPFHMCEPQYAALVFSKSCTLCGASATAKLDPNLHVRLCPSCRDTQLRELTPWNRRAVVDKTLVNHSYATRPKTEKKRPRYSEHPIYGLRQEINEVFKKQRQFQSAGHMDRLAKWEEERRKLVSARYKHGKRLAVYLESIETSRGEELSNLKQQRREDIKERLKALGWTNKDMKFSDSHAKPWRALVDPPKPLTERIWKNILPKLTALLEENRERHIAHGKLVRQIQRREHIHKFLLRLKNAEHPLEPIVDPLGAELPPHGSDDSDSFDSVRYFELGNPFPNTSFALAWDCLADLSEREIPVEEVQAELEARTAQIRQKVLEWKSGVEQKLGEKYKNGAEGVRQDVVVTASISCVLPKSHPHAYARSQVAPT